MTNLNRLIRIEPQAVVAVEVSNFTSYSVWSQVSGKVSRESQHQIWFSIGDRVYSKLYYSIPRNLTPLTEILQKE